MNDGVAVSVEHVSKKFCRTLRRSMTYGLKDVARNLVGLSSHPERLRRDEFWAVDDVSFEVKQGETVGIIGANGSGKTTMLSMLNGIIWPDKGSINIRGRTGALISVGAGFHPMLSGRENIYVQGGILGLRKREIDRKFDEIVEFADIGDFLDAPVKFYSSGMVVRLGFAIAINIEPEVLLIDEVLSEGDLSFQNKSLRRVAELRKKANAVVFVSHNLQHVRYTCDRVIVLHAGRMMYTGPTQDAIVRYYELDRQAKLASVKRGAAIQVPGHASSGDQEVIDVGVLDQNGHRVDSVRVGDDITLFFEFELLRDVEQPDFCAVIRDERGTDCVYQFASDNQRGFPSVTKGRYRLTVKYRALNLVPGSYTPVFGFRNGATGEQLEKIADRATFVVEGNSIPRGIVHVQSDWELERTRGAPHPERVGGAGS